MKASEALILSNQNRTLHDKYMKDWMARVDKFIQDKAHAGFTRCTMMVDPDFQLSVADILKTNGFEVTTNFTNSITINWSK